jgi:hypothetical protein
VRSVRQRFVLVEACERDDTPALHPKPAPRVRRFHIADIGDAGIGPLPLENEHWLTACPSAPSSVPAVGVIAYDRSRVIREYAIERRERSFPVGRVVRELANRLLAFRHRLQIAQRLADKRAGFTSVLGGILASIRATMVIRLQLKALYASTEAKLADSIVEDILQL